MHIGEKIYLLRKKNNMSQEKLSEKIHVSRQAISKWEKGISIPDTDNVILLSKYFQVPLEYLLDDKCDNEDNIEKPKINNIKENNKLDKLIYLGIFFIIISIVSVYVIQYIDMELYGRAYTYRIDYFFEMPTILFFLVGSILILFSVYKIFLLKGGTKNENYETKEK